MKMMKSHVKLFAASSISILAMNASFAPAAFAGDSKIYPGAACQPEFGSRASDLNSFGSFIQNKNTSTSMTVTCPIVRDNTTNSNGIAQVTVRIQTLRGENSVGSRCELTSFDDKGGAFTVDSASVFGQTGFHTLTLQDVDASQAHAGHYALKCSISQRFTRLIEYRVNEF
jgi:hypothetical protein